jgi:hypothetical protein
MRLPHCHGAARYSDEGFENGGHKSDRSFLGYGQDVRRRRPGRSLQSVERADYQPIPVRSVDAVVRWNGIWVEPGASALLYFDPAASVAARIFC